MNDSAANLPTFGSIPATPNAGQPTENSPATGFPAAEFSKDPFVSTPATPKTNLPPDALADAVTNQRVQDSLDQLDQIEGNLGLCESNLGLNELASVPSDGDSAPPANPAHPETKPTVEVIGSPESIEFGTPDRSPLTPQSVYSAEHGNVLPAEALPEQTDGLLKSCEPREIQISCQVKRKSELELEQASLEDDPALHEFDLAMNVLTEDLKEESRSQQNNQEPMDKPPLNLDPISNEFVFDVRDFADSTDQPTPIQRSFDAPQDAYDHNQPRSVEGMDAIESHIENPSPIRTDQFNSKPIKYTDNALASAANEPFGTDVVSEDEAGQALNKPTGNASGEFVTSSTAEQTETGESLFLAENDQVIKLNGGDGFDTIDLKCFDVSCANFSANRIVINDGHGIHFRIEHRDIQKALFANDCEIDLNKKR